MRGKDLGLIVISSGLFMMYLLSILYVIGNTFASCMLLWKRWGCEMLIGQRSRPWELPLHGHFFKTQV